MINKLNSKLSSFDLEERTFQFSKAVSAYCHQLPKTIINIEYIKQLIRSAGSVGANYIEANEALSKKDFIMRIKICRKEAKESRYWLNLTECQDESLKNRDKLINEATELIKIFSSIITKSI